MSTTDIAPATGHLFEDGLFGYDKDQVDRYVGAMARRTQDLAAEVQRLSTVEHELAAARVDIERLTAELVSVEPHAAIGPRIQHMLRLAYDEAHEVRVLAAEELRQARLDAQFIRASATRTAAEARRDFELALHERRRRHQAAAEEIIASAHRQAEQVIATAHRHGSLQVSTQ
jgi:cell division septum initiation protein DivIVA